MQKSLQVSMLRVFISYGSNLSSKWPNKWSSFSDSPGETGPVVFVSRGICAKSVSSRPKHRIQKIKHGAKGKYTPQKQIQPGRFYLQRASSQPHLPPHQQETVGLTDCHSSKRQQLCCMCTTPWLKAGEIMQLG